MKIFQKKNKRVFIPCNFETGIFGYWIDDKNKLYKDNIIIQSVNAIQYNRIKDKLFNSGEKAIFYIENEKAYIENKEKIVILKERQEKIFFSFSKIQNDFIVSICKKYGGCTIYTIKNNKGGFLHYKIEYWY